MKKLIKRFTDWYLAGNKAIQIALFPVLLLLLIAAFIKVIVKGFPNDDPSNQTK